MTDYLDDLERLEKLRASGSLSEDEFQREKAILLAGTEAAPPIRPRWRYIGGVALATAILMAVGVTVLLVMPPPKRAIDAERAPSPVAGAPPNDPVPDATPSVEPAPVPDADSTSQSPDKTGVQATDGNDTALPPVAASDESAKPGRCLLMVAGTNYINGTCTIALETDGSFVISNQINGRGYFARLQRDGKSGIGYWNGGPESEHAQDELGTMSRTGACWLSAKGQICAWAK